MIRKLVAGTAILLLAAVGFGAAVVIKGIYRLPERPGAEAVLFTIEEGESFSGVTRRLYGQGALSQRRPISIYAWVRRLDRRIKVGTYLLEAESRPKDILDKLVTGDVFKVSVTVPEGFMLNQIAGILASRVAIDSTVFAALTTDSTVLAGYGVGARSLEGYLFPDTYLLPWGMKPPEIIAAMVRRLEEVFDSDLETRARQLGMTRHEVLTLASVVEAETRLPEELPIVSAVYHNRLGRGMRLEADPTVAYAMGGYKGRLLFKNLKIDSPYNTYRHAGLPPGPICSPGEAAIRATLNPDPACKAVYFVARGNGSHVFSLNLRDHLAAVRKIRRAR